MNGSGFIFGASQVWSKYGTDRPITIPQASRDFMSMDDGVTNKNQHYLLAMSSNCLALIICPSRPDSLPFLP